ncbi:MAG: hypothetical protein QG628_1018 [Patescibacteria group bacterium]|jgi:hypothetical protein|nr:hypothetical protein [Patescibacteria group bacterium]
MSEIIDQTIEYMPYIGALAGVAAGVAAESVAMHRFAKDQQALSVALEGVGHEQPSEQLAHRLRRFGGATLVIAGSLVGFANGVVWQPQANDSMPPTVGVIVDHSGAVSADSEVLAGINEMVSVFDDKSFDATAYVAANGEVVPMQPNEVAEAVPFGDAPLDAATVTAFGANQTAREESDLSGTETGVFAVINGNRIGAVDSVIATAKAQKTPVFITNVEGESDPVIVEEFERIAKETGGAYFDVQTDNTEEMTKEIQETLEKNQLKRDQPNRWPLKIGVGMLSIATFASGIRNRSKESSRKRVRV